MLVDANCSFFGCFEWYKDGLSLSLFLRHVSHFGYSLPFISSKFLGRLGTDVIWIGQAWILWGVNVVVWRLIGLALGLGIRG